MALKTYNEKGERWCNKCKAYHHVSEFGKDNSNIDGLQYCCAKSRVKEKNDWRLKKVVKAMEQKPVSYEQKTSDIINDAVKVCKVIYPDLKLSNPWKYKTPDAWDQYRELKQIGYTNLTPQTK